MDFAKYLQTDVPVKSQAAEPEPDKASYSDYSNKVWKVEETTPMVTADAPEVVNQHSMSASSHIAETLGKLSDLTSKLTSAMRGDDKERAQSLEWIKTEYKVANKTQKVALPKELVDHYAQKAAQETGIDPSNFSVKDLKFGAQTIVSDDQYKRLQADVKKIKQYKDFADTDLHLLDFGGGKKVAIVIGDADAMNSLLAAERKRGDLHQEVQALLTTDKKKEPTVDTHAVNGKVAELEDKYPNKAKPEVLAENELRSPNAALPGQQKSNVREVA
jgi:hypothetical protein